MERVKEINEDAYNKLVDETGRRFAGRKKWLRRPQPRRRRSQERMGAHRQGDLEAFRPLKALLAAGLLCLAAASARAQIDDTKRFQLQGVYEQGLAEPGPKSPYIFAYIRAGLYPVLRPAAGSAI